MAFMNSFLNIGDIEIFANLRRYGKKYEGSECFSLISSKICFEKLTAVTKLRPLIVSCVYIVVFAINTIAKYNIYGRFS